MNHHHFVQSFCHFVHKWQIKKCPSGDIRTKKIKDRIKVTLILCGGHIADIRDLNLLVISSIFFFENELVPFYSSQDFTICIRSTTIKIVDVEIF